MRGKLAFARAQASQDGITPAGAGKTIDLDSSCGDAWDHPRRCGENFFACRNDGFARGSPPQVRGKPARFMSSAFASRITPAGAGKTRLKPSNSPQRWDHPRRCGENLFDVLIIPPKQGSPPQVRGKRVARFPHEGLKRITPAGAGKTYPHSVRNAVAEDHPRRCGENRGRHR